MRALVACSKSDRTPRSRPRRRLRRGGRRDRVGHRAAAVSPAATRNQKRRPPVTLAVVNAVATKGHQRLRLRGGDRHGVRDQGGDQDRPSRRFGGRTSSSSIAWGECRLLLACARTKPVARRTVHVARNSRSPAITTDTPVPSVRTARRPARGPRSAQKRDRQDRPGVTTSSTSPRRRRSTLFVTATVAEGVNETGSSDLRPPINAPLFWRDDGHRPTTPCRARRARCKVSRHRSRSTWQGHPVHLRPPKNAAVGSCRLS